MKKILVLFAAFFMFSAVNVYAQTMSKYGYPISSEKQNSAYSLINSINIFYGTDYMHYAEKASAVPSGYLQSSPVGSTLDNEAASLPGYGIKLSGIVSQNIPVYLSANFSTYVGNSDYTGALQTTPPTPIESTDGSQYINYGINAGYTFNLYNGKLAIIPNVGYEWIKWNRNVKGIILGTGDNVEHYEFNHYDIGIRGYYFLTHKFWLEGNYYYLINNSNKMTNNLGTADLGNKNGYELGAKIGYIAYRGNNIQVSPYVGINYIQDQEGQSPWMPTNSGIWQEPADQSNQLIFNLGIKVGF
ncbi:MAG: hypothetical protein M0016_07460 [Deltaproteobacteria bacterium]|jgi:hypothetical protein|nr:hypothetical protein [Deltaproteobacteria bacterium]MCL5879235.1 hypothetical protein [Deltaproteobacteria bacterium]MDA8304982.1 hypothetical protein [Deltaproteobacteria bacterium]